MDKHRRNMIEGWLSKAANQLHMAKEHLKYTRYSETIEASQECLELSAKSILSILDINYPRRHEWGEKQLADIARQIRERQILDKPEVKYMYLPRLIFS